MIYVDILHLNSDLDEAKLKEKAQLFHDSFLTKVLVTHIIRQTLHYYSISCITVFDSRIVLECCIQKSKAASD
jgi:hypothetical protein